MAAEIEFLGDYELFLLDDQALLVSLEIELAELLLRKGIRHLTVAKILDDDRELTQAVARSLFNRGAAGAEFPSKHDGKFCVALFEGRARLIQKGKPKPLTDPIPEFLRVCKEFELSLEPDPNP